MLDELQREVLVRRVGVGQLEGDLEHRLAEQRHPGRPVRLLQLAALRQRSAAVEDADVVEAEEAALEDVPPGRVLAVQPPGEVQQQLVERALQEVVVRRAAALLLQLVHEQHGPRVHRGVDVAEVPLVRGELAARMTDRMPSLIDISAPLQADVPSDPPGLQPQITYLDHRATAPAIAAFFGIGEDQLPERRTPPSRTARSAPITAPTWTRPTTTSRA